MTIQYYLDLMTMTDDLKYLQRLNFLSFGKLFYAGNNDMSYVEVQWNRFSGNTLQYIWTSGTRSLRIMAYYIETCKQGLDYNADIIHAAVDFDIEQDKKDRFGE